MLCCTAATNFLALTPQFRVPSIRETGATENIMDGSKNEVNKVTLDAGFKGAVLGGGSRIEFNANGGTDIYAPVSVMVHPAANTEPHIGQIMPNIRHGVRHDIRYFMIQAPIRCVAPSF